MRSTIWSNIQEKELASRDKLQNISHIIHNRDLFSFNQGCRIIAAVAFGVNLWQEKCQKEQTEHGGKKLRRW